MANSLRQALRRWERNQTLLRKRARPAKKAKEEKITAKERERRADISYLEKRKDDRVAGRKPVNEIKPQKLVDLAIKRNWNSKGYQVALQGLSAYDNPTEEQLAKVSEAKSRGPNYLGRTVSLTAGYKYRWWWRGSNGFTTQNVLMPAADVNRSQAMHPNIASMTQGEIIYMVGEHLIWADIPGDEFLSYSIDTLFLVYHALGRHHKAQKGVTIQFIDRRKAKTPDGQPAAFYHALDLYDIFGVGAWLGWPYRTGIRLLPRKFTQEYLSHGTVKNDDLRFQQAKLDDLIRDGLFDLFSAFKVSIKDKRAGLYSGQVILRTVGYPPPTPVSPRKRNRSDVQKKLDRRIYAYHDCPRVIAFTVELLTLVQKLTRNFLVVAGGEDRNTIEPPLHIFLGFLTFEKRPSRDAVFIEWIKAHYSASDVEDIYTDGAGGVQSGFTDVADNLPGVMQYLDLVRDAVYAFGLPELPANVVHHENRSTGRSYAAEDDHNNRNKDLATEYDEEAHKDELEKKRRERYQVKVKKREEKAVKHVEENGQEEAEESTEEDIMSPALRASFGPDDDAGALSEIQAMFG